eukprot:scaffold1282_cov251-Pinguiococcus_pyrenoidosus.AAC.73
MLRQSHDRQRRRVHGGVPRGRRKLDADVALVLNRSWCVAYVAVEDERDLTGRVVGLEDSRRRDPKVLDLSDGRLPHDRVRDLVDVDRSLVGHVHEDVLRLPGRLALLLGSEHEVDPQMKLVRHLQGLEGLAMEPHELARVSLGPRWQFNMVNGDILLGDAEVKAVAVAQELGQVEELGDQLPDILEVLTRRGSPTRLDALEKAVRLVELPVLERQSSPRVRLEAQEIVQHVPRAAVVGPVVERWRQVFRISVVAWRCEAIVPILELLGTLIAEGPHGLAEIPEALWVVEVQRLAGVVREDPRKDRVLGQVVEAPPGKGVQVQQVLKVAERAPKPRLLQLGTKLLDEGPVRAVACHRRGEDIVLRPDASRGRVGEKPPKNLFRGLVSGARVLYLEGHQDAQSIDVENLKPDGPQLIVPPVHRVQIIKRDADALQPGCRVLVPLRAGPPAIDLLDVLPLRLDSTCRLIVLQLWQDARVQGIVDRHGRGLANQNHERAPQLRLIPAVRNALRHGHGRRCRILLVDNDVDSVQRIRAAVRPRRPRRALAETKRDRERRV